MTVHVFTTVTSAASPNGAHNALVELESQGYIDTLVTQNVDGLHTAAGNRDVVDLHGRLDSVRCLDCDWRAGRQEWQRRLEDGNRDWEAPVRRVNPDGDVELDDDAYEGFEVPDCDACGGIVKPDVVFFGESVPRERVDRVSDAVRRAGALFTGRGIWYGHRATRVTGCQFPAYQPPGAWRRR